MNKRIGGFPMTRETHGLIGLLVSSSKPAQNLIYQFRLVGKTIKPDYRRGAQSPTQGFKKEIMKTLGETIKEHRTLMNLTLCQVEEAVGISNSYLSQLENGKIKKPSANVLYKLSCLYCVNIEVFLFAAGIIKDKPLANSNILQSITKATKLTPEEEAQLLQYLKFLRSR